MPYLKVPRNSCAENNTAIEGGKTVSVIMSSIDLSELESSFLTFFTFFIAC